jgi:hypothetical protein
MAGTVLPPETKIYTWRSAIRRNPDGERCHSLNYKFAVNDSG